MKRQVIEALLSVGLDTPDADGIVSAKLTTDERERIIREFIGAVHRMLDRRRPADPRQGWLALPEYEHIPVDAARDSLEDLRARIARLERRIQHYDYARRSPEKLKEDKRQLRAMKRLDSRIAPLFAADPNMDVSRAVEAYRQSLEKPAKKQRQKASKARWSRNEKSTTSG